MRRPRRPQSIAEQTEPIPTPGPAAPELSSEESSPLVAWRVAIAQIPQPKNGCFTATYPDLEWREIPCTSTPPYPQPPKRGPRRLNLVARAITLMCQFFRKFVREAQT